MHLRQRSLATLALLTLSSGATAASSVELGITGLLTPSACTPALSSNGLIDYGKISQQDLNIDRGKRLPVRYLSVTINCEAATRYALRMSDNRDGTANVNSEIYYGLGLDPSGNKIGLYSLTFDPKQTVIDSLPEVYGTESTSGGVAWRTANSNPIDIGSRSFLGFTDTVGSTSGPTAFQTLSSLVRVDTVIAAKNNLDLSSDVHIDGSSTMEVLYL
ncbi:DUF1120 domain-containing protein [Pseudomonas sp. 32A]|uniref:DUF1120 domain-containing protein n=1 Tax=Pseudomonas sp. 32A TaxID=651185 RepID=UPI0040460ADB